MKKWRTNNPTFSSHDFLFVTKSESLVSFFDQWPFRIRRIEEIKSGNCITGITCIATSLCTERDCLSQVCLFRFIFSICYKLSRKTCLQHVAHSPFVCVRFCQDDRDYHSLANSVPVSWGFLWNWSFKSVHNFVLFNTVLHT